MLGDPADPGHERLFGEPIDNVAPVKAEAAFRAEFETSDGSAASKPTSFRRNRDGTVSNTRRHQWFTLRRRGPVNEKARRWT